MKTILITGGCGFFGSNIAYYLRDKGYRICILDNLSRVGSESNLEWLKQNVSLEFFKADVRIREDVERVFQEVMPDAVFHLAGQVAMTTSISNPRLDFEINALGTLNVLEAIRQFKRECTIVYSSTNKVYGDLEHYTFEETDTRYKVAEKPDGFDEHELLDFHSPYGCSKGSADQYVLDFSRLFGIKGIVFRHSTIYGGRQYATYDQGWIGWFCQQALEIKNDPGRDAFTISGNGKQVRDVLHVDDAVALYASCIDLGSQLKGNAYNIGGGMKNSLSLLELFGILEEELHIKMNYRQIAPRESDQKVFVANIGKVAAATGWSPKVDKRTGVKKMLEWLQSSYQPK